MTLIQDIPEFEKPREKAMHFGANALSNRELIALLIRTGTKNHSSLDIASDLLKEAGSLGRVFNLDVQELKHIRGISDVKAIEIQAINEILKRIHFENVAQEDVITSPQAFLRWLIAEIGYARVENFMVVFLDTAHHILSYEILSTGTVNSATVYPREVMKKALLKGASSIIAVHNHPSRSLKVSSQDRVLTKEIIQAGEIVGVDVLDHIIVTENAGYSILHERTMEVNIK